MPGQSAPLYFGEKFGRARTALYLFSRRNGKIEIQQSMKMLKEIDKR
jgi:hypothetical protein